MSGVRTESRPPAVEPPAPRRAHPARGELLRGSAPWAGAAALTGLAFLLVTEADSWQGSWGETQALLQLAAIVIIGPLAGAAGCWQGQREHRRRTHDLLAGAVRGPLARLLTAALPTALWATAGYLTATAAALLATWPYTSAGAPRITVPLTGVVFIVSMTLIGHVTGAVVRWRLLAPAFAAGAYVVLWLLPNTARETPAARHLVPVAPEHLLAESVPVWWQPLATTGWTGGLAAAAVLAYTARRRWTALLPLAVALTAGALLMQNGERMYRPDPLTQRQICDESVRPAICVRADYPGLLPQIKNALTDINAQLEGVENLPARFTDLDWGPKSTDAHLPSLTPYGQSVVRGRLADPERYAWEAAMALLPSMDGGCDARLEDNRVSRIDTAVEEWLAPDLWEFDELSHARAVGDTEKVASIKAEQKALDAVSGRLRAMDQGERRQWLSDYFATVGTCDMDEVPAL
ncbi:hypothetical protein [Streptomyces jumonjinensis]|uniref:hypothetical protein n=1 Tax=Streptomyces jumonjinensis TaxID=1945 RepID=UPI00379C3A90